MSDKENQDNQNWLDLLGGKSVPNADPDTILEAQALRAVLLERAAAQQEDSDIPYPQVLKKTLDILETEGYFNSQVSKSAQADEKTEIQTESFWFRFMTSWRYQFVYALATSVLVAVLILPLVFYDDTTLIHKEPSREELEAFIPKSTTAAYPNQKSYPEPELEAVKLKKQLEDLNIAVKLTVEGEIWRVEATLPAEKSPALQMLLKHYQLMMPPGDNRLQVDISKAES